MAIRRSFSEVVRENFLCMGVPEQARKRYLKFQLTMNYCLRRKEMNLRFAESMITLTLPSESLKKPNDGDIEPWPRTVFETSRGFELGAFDASILATAMKKHSSKWSSISLG